jgi:gamma-glutamylcyclotransferase (GGCT)/AIG2-like uncharacterized protein YtfP
MPLLFTYGTLRDTALADRVLGNEAVLLEQNIIAPGYQIHTHGPFPFATPCQSTEDKIVGDIFYITPNSLDYIDDYEQVNEGVFQRIFDERINCYIYVKGDKHNAENAVHIPSGNWLNKT